MTGRYQIRVFESVDKDGVTSPGAVFGPSALTFSIYADSSEHAELTLRKDIQKGKWPRGIVYQICPPLGHGLIRSFASALDGSFFHVFMDPAAGPYSELRRLRLPKPESATPSLAARS